MKSPLSQAICPLLAGFTSCFAILGDPHQKSTPSIANSMACCGQVTRPNQYPVEAPFHTVLQSDAQLQVLGFNLHRPMLPNRYL